MSDYFFFCRKKKYAKVNYFWDSTKYSREEPLLLLRIYFCQIEMMAINQPLEVVFMELIQLFSKIKDIIFKNKLDKSTMNAV